ncbi:MAG: MMPL family transporter [Halioglobus sp.]|nr:MMPL family transporter [Halioglobus sp.]
MTERLMRTYEALVLRRPLAVLLLLAIVLAAAASQLGKIRLDASADSLMLRGDPALEFFREVNREYDTEDFLLLTWQPDAPLLSPGSLEPLGAMADELRGLRGVSSVVTVLDVPLIESTGVSLSDITSSESLPTLQSSDVDRDKVLREFTSSPIYADLLVSRDGELSAVQINLERDTTYDELLRRREDLRELESEGALGEAQEAELSRVEKRFKEYSARALERQSELVENVRAIADRYRQHAQIFVGGVPMIAADMVRFVANDLVVFGSAILGIMLVVLAVIFRRVRWVVIPLATCSSTVVVMLGLLGFLDWRMTVISSNFVAVLLIITLAIAIHLVVRYRELHAAEPDGDLYQRVRETMRFMSVPCFYTGITTIVAFMSLVVSGIQPVIDFGWMMTVGIAVALVMAFLIVPSLMLLWPAGRPHRHSGTDPSLTHYFARLTDRFGGTVLGVSLALVALILWGVSKLEVENRFIDYFHESTEIYQGMKVLDKQLGGTIPLDIVLEAPEYDEALPGLENLDASTEAPPVAEDDPFLEGGLSSGDGGWDDDFDSSFGDPDSDSESFQPSYWFTLAGMRRIDELHDHVDSLSQTGKVLSLATVFDVVKNVMGEDIGGVELALVQKSLPEDMAELMVDPYFSADKEQARLNVRVKETSNNLRRNQFLRDLRTHMEEELGYAPDEFRLTGMLVLYNNVLQSLFRSQILTLGAVFGAILIMFVLLFRSLSLALIALAPNLLAAGLVLGVMGLAGIPLDIMTITIAAIVVGIGVDDCIHYVYRYLREFPVDRNYRATMYRCHDSIGRAMYYTTLTVVVGFCTLTLSNFTPSIYFGLLTVLAMVAAVLGALLLLPQLIMVFKPLGPQSEAGAEQAPRGEGT